MVNLAEHEDGRVKKDLSLSRGAVRQLDRPRASASSWSSASWPRPAPDLSQVPAAMIPNPDLSIFRWRAPA